MNYKQLIRAEIERLYNGEAPSHDQQCDFADGYFTGIAAISKFIDSLPEEKTSQNVEGAVKEYFGEHWPGIETAEQCNTDMHFTPPAIMRLAQHFYELGKQSNHTADGKVEEAAEEYRRESFKKSVMPQIDGPANEYGGSIKDAFIAGAEWQKKQMMNEAVDGIITTQNLNRYILVPNLDESLTYGNKVKVIIVKEDE